MNSIMHADEEGPRATHGLAQQLAFAGGASMWYSTWCLFTLTTSWSLACEELAEMQMGRRQRKRVSVRVCARAVGAMFEQEEYHSAVDKSRCVWAISLGRNRLGL